MGLRKEGDIVLMVIFIIIFFCVGIYVGVKDQNGEKAININIKSQEGMINAVPGANEIIVEEPKKAIEEMPALIASEENSKSEDYIRIIEMNETKFNPKELSISAGTTVFWVNKDKKRNYRIYENAANSRFNSGQIEPEKSFNYTFTEEGTYKFNDAIFTYMHGTIIVGG